MPNALPTLSVRQVGVTFRVSVLHHIVSMATNASIHARPIPVRTVALVRFHPSARPASSAFVPKAISFPRVIWSVVGVVWDSMPHPLARNDVCVIRREWTRHVCVMPALEPVSAGYVFLSLFTSVILNSTIVCFSFRLQEDLDVYSASGDLGCQSCDCHVIGSASSKCDRDTGQCECRENVIGRRCGQCEENYAGMDEHGCHGTSKCAVGQL